MAKGVFERLVPKGENPAGISVITPNGVAHAGGDYPRNQKYNFPGEGTDGDRWNLIAGSEMTMGKTPWDFPGSSPNSPPRTTKRNRSGE